GVAPAGIPLPAPEGAAAPVDRAAADLPDDSFLDRPLRLAIAARVAALRSRHDGEVLPLRRLAGLDDPSDAGRVHRHRLLHEDVLPGVDGRLEVDGAEYRRGGQQDDFY